MTAALHMDGGCRMKRTNRQWNRSRRIFPITTPASTNYQGNMTEKVFSMWLECFSMIKDMFQRKKGKYDDISFFLSIFADGIFTE